MSVCLSVCRVHVRRTDKVGTEAAFHPIEEYMIHVEEQFQLLARRVHVDKKRVYLATDDPSLLQEAKNKSVTVSACAFNHKYSFYGHTSLLSRPS